MRPHQKLDLWRRAIEFVVSIYRATERFPKEEKFGLTSQDDGPRFQSRLTLQKVLHEPQLKSSCSSCLYHKDLQVRQTLS